MTQWVVKRTVKRPVERVFSAFADLEHLPDVHPDVVKIEIHSDQKSGVGTRFSETRLMNGKEVVTDLEVTEWVDNERLRMVADTHGTVWDTIFETRPVAGGTDLTVTMDARNHKLLPKILVPLMKGMIGKNFEKHIEVVHEHLESEESP